jgi:hypothetical protein
MNQNRQHAHYRLFMGMFLSNQRDAGSIDIGEVHAMMPPMGTIAKALHDAEPLSQVVFVHDYIQLVFQELRLSIYSCLSIRSSVALFEKNSPGYCDKLVALIGQRAVSVNYAGGVALDIAFEKGDNLSISLRDLDVGGPEFLQLDQPGMLTIVEPVP